MSELNENPFIHKQAFGLLVGAKIGFGMGREVYASRLNARDVVKVEDRGESFQNIIEWEFWNRVQYSAFAKWFAPCLHISSCGAVLIMRRTEPLPAKQYPTHLPAFLTDCKRDNFGMFNGRFVCHDYGTSLVTERGLIEKMKRVRWH